MVGVTFFDVTCVGGAVTYYRVVNEEAFAKLIKACTFCSFTARQVKLKAGHQHCISSTSSGFSFKYTVVLRDTVTYKVNGGICSVQSC